MQHGVEVLDEYPIAGFALLVVVAAVGYVGVSLLLDGAVNVLETATFAVVFAGVYLAGTWYIDQRRTRDGDPPE